MEIKNILTEADIDSSLLPPALLQEAETQVQKAINGDFSLWNAYHNMLASHPSREIYHKLSSLSRQMSLYVAALLSQLEASEFEDGGLSLVRRIEQIQTHHSPLLTSLEALLLEDISKNAADTVVLRLTIWRILAQKYATQEMVSQCDALLHDFQGKTKAEMEKTITLLLSLHQKADGFLSDFVLDIARTGKQKNAVKMRNIVRDARIYLHNIQQNLNHFERQYQTL